MDGIKTNYVLLSFFWILYCALHSLLAHERVKKIAEKLLQNRYKYYRPIYNVFAALTLLLLIWFHFSFDNQSIFFANGFFEIAGYCIAFTGVIIMTICIKKYFYELSGLQALKNIQANNTLQTSGLHRFVRHPLYFGTLMFIWGLLLIMPYYHHLIAAIIISMYVWLGIYLEEKKLLEEFGDSYVKYKKSVPKLLPFTAQHSAKNKGR